MKKFLANLPLTLAIAVITGLITGAVYLGQSVPLFGQVLIWITVAGGIGGAINALITQSGFELPGSISAKTVENRIITAWSPGFLGNVLVGAVGAIAGYLLSGSGVDLLAEDSKLTATLTSSQVGTAILLGVGGAKILTEAANKQAIRLNDAVTIIGNPPQDQPRSDGTGGGGGGGQGPHDNSDPANDGTKVTPSGLLIEGVDFVKSRSGDEDIFATKSMTTGSEAIRLNLISANNPARELRRALQDQLIGS